MKFSRRAQLVGHKIIHSTERPFVCDICGKSFKEERSLRIHLERHAGTLKRPYKCSFCEKALPTRHSKLLHERTHTKVVSLMLKIIQGVENEIFLLFSASRSI